MIRLTIDGREVTVPEGSTVLQAARAAGAEVPTLCHIEGMTPPTSCFVCVVEVEGRGRLLPSCALPAEDGMVVRTDSDEIRKTRRRAMEFLLSDHVGDCEAPCHLGCPIGLSIPDYLRALRGDGADAAARLMADETFLGGTLARVCPGFCERACRRRLRDDPVAVRAARRYIAETGSVEPARPAPSGKRVAIVGAGPCGLTAAYDLLREGHACVVFDARPEAGGRLRYAFPRFRLPLTVLQGEIGRLQALGCEFRFEAELGRDVEFEALRAEFGAVFLAFGASRPALLQVNGERLTQDGLEFIEDVAENAERRPGRAIVVGLPETGLDIARTAVRVFDETLFLCTGRVGALVAERLERAEEEGVRVETGVEVQWVEEAEGGFAVNYDGGGEERRVEAKAVIAARGREADDLLVRRLGMSLVRGRLRVNPETLETDAPGVFAGGEAVRGRAYAAQAVADGRQAARSIAGHLAGRELEPRHWVLNTTMRRLSEAEADRFFSRGEGSPRVKPPVSGGVALHEERERTLSEESALAEARRCLSCDCAKKETCGLRELAGRFVSRAYDFQGERREYVRVETHPDLFFEPGKCIACGRCIEITRAAGEAYGLTFLGRGFRVEVGVPFGKELAEALAGTARQCVEVCPTGALAWRRRGE